MKINTRITAELAQIEKRADLYPHPRPRIGKTAAENKANPNRESERKSRQYARAVNAGKHEGRFIHK